MNYTVKLSRYDLEQINEGYVIWKQLPTKDGYVRLSRRTA